MDPIFLSLNEVFEIHQDQIVRYGGDSGIRDMDALKAITRKINSTFTLPQSAFEWAAAYLFHLVQNHPFVDGNKRVGAVSAIVYLLLNGYDFDAPEEEFAEMVLSVARGELDKADVAVFIHRWATQVH